MADPVATEPKAKVYDESSDADSVRAAAADLDKTRAENRIPRAEDEPIDRGYRYYAGEKAGEPVEPEQTLTPERASRDLRMVREYEAASQQPAPEVVASAVDQIRAANNGEPQPQQPSELNDQARAHMAAEQAQQDDVHPDVRAALQNEHVREALAKEVASVEQARAQYAASARGAAQLAAASLLASFPELAQVPTNQLQGAISVIAQKDPARAQAIGAALERTKALYDASQQAQAAQQKIQAENLKAWTVAQEQKFEREVLARESPESLAKIKAILPEVIQGYGISKEEFVHALETQPIMRSAAFQAMLIDAAKFRSAQKEVANKVDRSAPPVFRPGVSQPRGNDAGIEAAIRAFKNNPGPQTGAALLQARRAATRR